MKRLFLGVLLSVAACNTSQTGANGNVAFTPVECGELGGCDFADSIGVGGKINVTISGLDGTPTAGLDLASREPDKLDVVPGEDVGGEPSWELTALTAGVVELAAIDPDGNEVDFIQVPMQEVTKLTMVPFAGSPEPIEEVDVDEGYQVMAGTAASWSVRPLIAGDVTTMGRYTFVNIQGTPDITPYEAVNSDPANGYLYIENIATGDYPIEFQLVIDGEIYVTAIIHAITV
jgi:hypothetical protein